MKAVYLIAFIVSTITILILSFANWNTYSIRFFFSSYSMPLTMPLFITAALGALAGASLALFYKMNQEEGEESESDSENF